MFTLLSPARAQPGSPPNFHPPVLFDLQTCLTSGERPDRIALADVNGDLWPDIAVANEFSCQIEPGGTPVFTVSFFRNTGDWNPHSDALVLQQKIVLPCGLFPTEVAFARIDADTRLDLLVVTPAGDSFNFPGRLLYFRNHGQNPPALLFQSCSALEYQAYGLTVADIENDGDHEAAVAAYNPAEARNPRQVIAGDLNRDGLGDVVTANADTHNLSVLIGRP